MEVLRDKRVSKKEYPHGPREYGAYFPALVGAPVGGRDKN